MSAEELINLLQLIMLTATTVIVMLTAAFKRDHGLVNALTQCGLVASLLVFLFVEPVLPLQVTPLMIFDEYTIFFSSLIIIGAIAVTALAFPYFEKHNEHNEEFYLLLLMATLGAVVMAGSSHFVSFFIGMEMLGVSLYVMIAYTVHADRPAKFPLEASIKYLVMSGISSAVMLFGIALVYAATGTFEFAGLAAATGGLSQGLDPLLLIGFLMLLAGVAFKLSLVPFHMWTPDVYEGAPVPVTAYLATVSKIAMVAVALRLMLNARIFDFSQVTVVLSLLAAASMIFGNLLALMQSNVKRLFAYSSIAHLGYLLVAVIAAAVIPDMLSVESVAYYSAAYLFTTLGGFAVVNALSNAGKEHDLLTDYQGLFWRNPVLASVMIIVLLSLAGIPLTAGFIGKFYIFTTGIEGQLWFLVTMLVIGSAIGLYYYLRLIYTMLQAAPGIKDDPASSELPLGARVVMAAVVLAIIWLGVYPMPLMESLQAIAGNY
jgi:NADH-quinone oxidoreductase subunit N